MKKLGFATIMILLVAVAQNSYGQFEDLIKGGKADANYLVKGYSSPLVKAIGMGLNQGWYNTADTHKFPGGDLTISVAMVGVPSADKVFNVDNNKMTELQLDGASNGKGSIPTFFGSTTNQQFSLKSSSTTKYDAPNGQLKRVPIPIANISIGLPKGTEIKLRFIPNVNMKPIADLLGYDNASFGLWGLGVKHDIKQYIPGIKSLPFSMSVFAGYTNFNTKINNDDSKGQVFKSGVSSTTVQVLASKKLTVLTVYGGLGVDIMKGNVKMLGTYEPGVTPLVDPVNFSVSATNPRITAGLRLKLGPITFHGDYTQSKYSAITAGFGISVR